MVFVFVLDVLVPCFLAKLKLKSRETKIFMNSTLIFDVLIDSRISFLVRSLFYAYKYIFQYFKSRHSRILLAAPFIKT